MPIRTYNPWGHVSRSERQARQGLTAHIRIHARISKEPEWDELSRLCEQARRGTLDDAGKLRVKELANALNAKGLHPHLKR